MLTSSVVQHREIWKVKQLAKIEFSQPIFSRFLFKSAFILINEFNTSVSFNILYYKLSIHIIL